MHYKVVCSCGIVLSQCRCNGDRKTTIIEKGCEKCHPPKIEIIRDMSSDGGIDWKLKTDYGFLSVTFEDLEYLKNELQEIFHGED